MSPAALVTIGGVAVLVLALLLLMRREVAGRRTVQHELAAARHELAELRGRFDELVDRTERLREQPAAPSVVPSSELLITTAGVASSPAAPAPDRVVLSGTIGEPLVKAVAFGHGLRRALSAESRNRIVFEMRREVRRARKQRRRDLKQARRDLHAAQRNDLRNQRREDAA